MCSCGEIDAMRGREGDSTALHNEAEGGTRKAEASLSNGSRLRPPRITQKELQSNPYR